MTHIETAALHETLASDNAKTAPYGSAWMDNMTSSDSYPEGVDFISSGARIDRMLTGRPINTEAATCLGINGMREFQKWVLSLLHEPRRVPCAKTTEVAFKNSIPERKQPPISYDFSESNESIVFQNGEASWASFKCGGGPHTSAS